MTDEIHDFTDWQPELPSENDWRKFKYAPANIYFEAKMYAANCRHETSLWNEHPWCAICLVRACIPICKHPDTAAGVHTDCYICNRMGYAAKIQFLDDYAAYDGADPNQLTAFPSQLHPKIRCQLDADMVMQPFEPSPHPAHWDDEPIGWTRPASMMPVFEACMAWNEIKQTDLTETKKTQWKNYQAWYAEAYRRYGDSNHSWTAPRVWSSIAAGETLPDENKIQIELAASKRKEREATEVVRRKRASSIGASSSHSNQTEPIRIPSEDDGNEADTATSQNESERSENTPSKRNTNRSGRRTGATPPNLKDLLGNTMSDNRSYAARR
ncbi:MAG: hypothetical protein AAFY15_16045, partial [Cyanobacteria bacterium J06648_11]